MKAIPGQRGWHRFQGAWILCGIPGVALRLPPG